MSKKLYEKDGINMKDNNIYNAYLKEENSNLRDRLAEAYQTIGALEVRIEILQNKLNEKEGFNYER